MERIYKFIKGHAKDIFAILTIILISTIIRIFMLSSVPTNISGDEVTNLLDVYKILFGNQNYILAFMGDGSVAGVVFYWPALLVKLLGFNNTIFALRLSFSIISILSLIPFYLILKEKSSSLISFVFTSLLSANYVFLNFSRTAFVNMTMVFSGLFLILFIQKAVKEQKTLWYILAGISAGISFYGYHFGRVLIVVVFLYLLILFIKNKLRIKDLKGIVIFSATAIIISLPFILSIYSDDAQSILRRPQSTFAFSKEKVSASSYESILLHQLDYTFRGFLLVDGTVMGEGVENLRYVPFHTSPVDIFIKIIFIAGIILLILLRERNIAIWLLTLLFIIVIQIFTDDPPNLSRGIFYLPFIYFICGAFIFRLLTYLKKLSIIPKLMIFVYALIIIFGITIFVKDTLFYFDWMTKQYEYDTRQPAIDYNEFSVWQNYQIKLIKNNQEPVSNYQWYDIRKSIIKNN